MWLSWGEAQAAAKDRTLWRDVVVAFCPAGDEEDKKVSTIRCGIYNIVYVIGNTTSFDIASNSSANLPASHELRT